jgi:hypothetical protein
MPKFIGYLFIVIAGILFVHYSAICQKMDNKYKNKSEQAIIDGLSKPTEYNPISVIPDVLLSPPAEVVQ